MFHLIAYAENAKFDVAQDSQVRKKRQYLHKADFSPPLLPNCSGERHAAVKGYQKTFRSKSTSIKYHGSGTGVGASLLQIVRWIPQNCTLLLEQETTTTVYIEESLRKTLKEINLRR